MDSKLDLRKDELTGQVAIVTGGGRGIGRVIAQTLAAAGVAVVVAARSEDQLAETVTLIEGAGGRAIPVAVDVTDREAVEGMVEVAERQLGPVDLLVNNAAIPGPLDLMWKVDPDEWWRTVEINLRGPFLCARAVMRYMSPRRQGRIINVSSGTGTQPVPYFSAYAISKTALLRFTETLAVEAKEDNISVFAIDPGPVRTAIAEYLMESVIVQEHHSYFPKTFKEGRDFPPEWAAQLVIFLASGRADALTGRFIQVTDDVPALMTTLIERAGAIQAEELYTLRLRQ